MAAQDAGGGNAAVFRPRGHLYGPLDKAESQTRLIKIQPAETDNDFEVIRCTMIIVSLRNLSEKYLALSYVWGADRAAEPLLVNGHEVHTTANLADFLVRYRKMSSVVPDWIFAHMYLWVDAVCINQDDVAERSSQVEIMGDIYKQAHATLAWIGVNDGDSEYAVKTIMEISQMIAERPPDSDPLAWMNAEQTHLWGADAEKDPSGISSYNRFWDAANRLLDRDYWGRAWIAQELALSKGVFMICGQRSMPWHAILVVLSWLLRIEGRSRPEFVDVRLWPLLSTRNGRRLLHWGNLTKFLNIQYLVKAAKETKDEDLPLLWKDFVMYTRILQATDPVDKLYSVLGMVGRGIKADYSVSVETAYCQFAKKWVAAESRLSLLSYSGHGLAMPTALDHPLHNMFIPSWVPNWDVLSKATSWGEFHIGSNGKHADGNPPSVPQPSWFFEGDALVCSGIRCDAVSTARTLKSANQDWYRFCDEYVVSRGGRPYPSGIPALQALGRLVFLNRDPVTRELLGSSPAPIPLLRTGAIGVGIMGASPDGVHPIARFNLNSGHDMYNGLIGETPVEGLAELTGEVFKMLGDARFLQSHAPALVAVLIALALNHAAFATESGYIGWGPSGMETGDLVCVILGCEMPVVLRKVDTHYIHMGPCFVIGLMDGEAISGIAEDSDHIQQFRIV